MTDEAYNERNWAERIATDPSACFDDWQPYSQSAEGIFVETRYEDIPPDLPPELREAWFRLADYVPDERTLDVPEAPFNGPRYCLRRVVPEVRRFGEQSGCILVFGPSDYRTFLITNGIDVRWASLAGLDSQFRNPSQWASRFGGDRPKCDFYRNSFGVNVLVSAIGDDGERCFIFRERNSRTAVHSASTVGSVDEGLRRAYGNKIFDQKSLADPAPDIDRSAWRAMHEELGVSDDELRGTRPILLSVGEVRSIRQPAALYYWPTTISVSDMRFHIATAQDRHLEFGETHFVRTDLRSVTDFILSQESKAPVESWVAATAMYSLKARPQKRVFLSHSSRDKPFVRSLGRRLQNLGVFVWMDESELGVGDSLVSRLADAVHAVDFVIAVISRASVRSKWVLYELRHAISEEVEIGRTKVLIVLKEDCDLPPFLRDSRLYADCRTKSSRRKALGRLFRTILGS